MIWHILILFADLLSANDTELIERLRRRDPDAMSDLYDRYSRIVYSVILRIVRNASVAEELAQETFLRAWNRAGDFDAARARIGPWLLTIARNRAIDYLRSTAGQQQATTFELVSSERVTLFVNTEDRMVDQEQARRIRAAFSKLKKINEKCWNSPTLRGFRNPKWLKSWGSRLVRSRPGFAPHWRV